MGERKSSETELALLEMKVRSMDEIVKRNSSEIEALEDRQAEMSKRVDIFEGGVTWIYKGVFVVTALFGAFLAFVKA